jgi:hypothetical protein
VHVALLTQLVEHRIRQRAVVIEPPLQALQLLDDDAASSRRRGSLPNSATRARV